MEINHPIYDKLINERIVEIPYVFMNVQKYGYFGCNILDFGNTESTISIHLQNYGYHVTGIDLRNGYDLKHQNLEQIVGDIREYDFKDKKFDIIIALSSLEHTGLDFYTDKILDAYADKKF